MLRMLLTIVFMVPLAMLLITVDLMLTLDLHLTFGNPGKDSLVRSQVRIGVFFFLVMLALRYRKQLSGLI